MTLAYALIVLYRVTANKMQLVLPLQTSLCDLHMLVSYIKYELQNSVCRLVNLVAKLVEKYDLSLLIFVYNNFETFFKKDVTNFCRNEYMLLLRQARIMFDQVARVLLKGKPKNASIKQK